MKLINGAVAVIGLFTLGLFTLIVATLPARAQNANGASGATTYGPTSGGSVGSTSVSPPRTVLPPTSHANESASTRAFHRAKEEHAAAKKGGGPSVTFGPEDDSADGGPLKKPIETPTPPDKRIEKRKPRQLKNE
jgi:hypothetical protein